MDNKILVTRSSMPSMEEYIEEIRSIWDSHWLTNMGEKHKALQAELQKYMGVPAVELLTNGHMALELSLQAMNLQGEVITTPFTFASTTHAIVRNGLEPVFCDIDPEIYTMEVTQTERLNHRPHLCHPAGTCLRQCLQHRRDRAHRPQVWSEGAVRCGSHLWRDL